MPLTAVLLDATGIQQYVFGSPQLKENIGASFLVENIYEGILRKTLEKLQFKNVNLDEWREHTNSVNILKPEIEMEIGYIGGGNGLLFFKEDSKAKSFVREWTKQLLIESPGLRTAVAINEFEINDFSNGLKKLFRTLKINKFQLQPKMRITNLYQSRLSRNLRSMLRIKPMKNCIENFKKFWAPHTSFPNLSMISVNRKAKAITYLLFMWMVMASVIDLKHVKNWRI
jgi:hypothetical protein